MYKNKYKNAANSQLYLGIRNERSIPASVGNNLLVFWCPRAQVGLSRGNTGHYVWLAEP